ncbi:hypothetical protein NOR_05882 [Metarhizium rileyi]|uniref:Uncharacterized protein n=2 Tax=Metarhizium rileyi (strain RCEF 4871) TaxID=1649241 RepID=A0A167BR31_METRR|nr:hypothetical protein NOR_05882 [Metarhizium rileyi RCEF 4871]
MSSRRRHHSGPPRQYSRGPGRPDDRSWHGAVDYSPRPSGLHAVPLPPPAYEPSYPRSETWPADRSEPARGRGRERRHQDEYNLWEPRYEDDGPRSRRPRRPHSHDRMSDDDPVHSRPPPSRHARVPRSRSSASSASRPARRESPAPPWWQNPVVRTCAITAASTALSAALDSRGDPGDWKGAKGAKVAVASLGSALVDGFLGHKHPNSMRQEVVRKGVQVAMEETEKKKKKEKKKKRQQPSESQDARHRRRSRHSDGSRSHSRHR